MDFFDALPGGVDGGRHASFLKQDQIARGINLTLRGGCAVTRPGIKLNLLTFDTPASQVWFEREIIQGMETYRYSDGRLIAVVGGRPFSINPMLGTVVDLLEDSAATNRRSATQAWLCQAEQYMIVQDAQNRPFIIEGADIRRSVASDSEVPVGSAMAFGQGRLIVANPDGTQFVCGDVAGGATNILKFTDLQYLNEAPAFSMPQHMGPIRGFSFIEQQDTGTGVGALLVGGPKGTMAYELSVNREDWLNVDISRVALGNTGFVGPKGFANVNGDVFFRAMDGIRSYRMARAEIQTWGRVPVSREVSNYTEMDTPHWLKYAQAVNFDNRFICTTAPVQENDSFVHLGMIVLDFDLLGSAGQKSPPCWEGVWTGIHPAAVAVGLFDDEERCFALCADADGINRLYEVTRNAVYDLDREPIPAVLETKMLGFEQPYNLKRLFGMDLWIEDIIGEVSFRVLWRPDGYAEWTEWHSWSECALDAQCGGADCIIGSLTPQSVARRKLPEPPKECSATSPKFDLRYGYTFQFRIEWTGHAKLVRVRFHAETVTEETQGACPTTKPCEGFQVCPPDDFAYSLASEYAGCLDRLLATATFTFTPPDFPMWDLRTFKFATVQGETWEIKAAGANGQSYAHGAIKNGRMVGLPDRVSVADASMELRAWCVNPFQESDNSAAYNPYSYYYP